MKFRVSLLILILLGMGVVMQACSRPPAPQNSCNFVQNPELQRVSWKAHLPVKLYVHNSVPTAAYPALQRAIAEYNTKVGKGQEIFTVEAYGTSGPLNPQKDGYSTIYWFDTWDPTRPTEQARTTIYWSGNEIFEADMRINASDFNYNWDPSSTDFSNVDLDSLFLHELGHVIGLAHTMDQGSAMHPTLDEGQVRRALGAVDLSDISCEY